MHRIIKNIFTSLTLLFFIGCVSPPTIYTGAPIHGIDKLDQLDQGIATMQDVRNMMGEGPSGYGKMRLKPDSELLDVWSYRYMVQKGAQANKHIVLIFIDENHIYKGHIAFISDTLVEDSPVGSMNFDTGQEPYTDILETSLHLGKSSMDDVLQVLGKPNGKGGFMLPSDPTGRTTWSYYYEKKYVKVHVDVDPHYYLEGESTRIFLFIYFDSNDKYDGYMWFSGTEEISK